MPDNEIEVSWTRPALQRLDEIYEELSFRAKSVDPAIRVTDAIFDRTDQLKTFPESGPQEPLLQKIGQDSRYLVEGTIRLFTNITPSIRW